MSERWRDKKSEPGFVFHPWMGTVDELEDIIAAKDAEIARLTQERDDWKSDALRHHKTSTDRYEEIARLRTVIADVDPRNVVLISKRPWTEWKALRDAALNGNGAQARIS